MADFQSPEMRAEMLSTLTEAEPADTSSETVADVNPEETVVTEEAVAEAPAEEPAPEQTDDGKIPRSRYNEVAEQRDAERHRVSELERQIAELKEAQSAEEVDELEQLLSEYYDDPDEATIDPEMLRAQRKSDERLARLEKREEARENKRIIDMWTSEIETERSRIKEALGVDIPQEKFWEQLELSKGQASVSDISKELETFAQSLRPGPAATPRSATATSPSAVRSDEPKKREEINSVADASRRLRELLT